MDYISWRHFRSTRVRLRFLNIINTGIEDWPELLASDAVLAIATLDRLLHVGHGLDIDGRSYRLRDLERAIGLRRCTGP